MHTPSKEHKPWYCLPAGELAAVLATDLVAGLTREEAATRLVRRGPNVFGGHSRESAGRLIGKQFKSPLVFILLAAGIAVLALGEFLDAAVIFAALCINVFIGAFQEGRASRAFEKLAQYQQKRATVIRDGHKIVVDARLIVPGDVVLLEVGSSVPADLRLIRAENLFLNEAMLTGEWAPVPKETSVQKSTGEKPARTSSAGPPLPLIEKSNMAWMGTLVTEGYGIGIVVATGERTEMGAIAQSLRDITPTLTPVQHGVRSLARFLFVVVLVAVVLIFIFGLLRGEPFASMLLLSIAIAVAIVPEGLLPAVTVVLALGMEAILKKGGLVRNLLAAETLGSTTVILTDKTGTLTEAHMKLEQTVLYDTLGERFGHASADSRELLSLAMLASDAFVEESNTEEELIVRGRPTEQAIVLAGIESGLVPEELSRAFPQIEFLPFASSRRYAASLHRLPGQKKNRLILTGAPEMLLARSSLVYKQGEGIPLTDAIRSLFEQAQERASEEGMRLIAVAYKDTRAKWIPSSLKNPQQNGDSVAQGNRARRPTKEKNALDGSVFVGLLVFADPLRKEVKAAIQRATRAGARVIMLTGDNPQTARAIARRAGIARPGAPVVVGADIAAMDDAKLLQTLSSASVFARVLPQQKLRIAHVLKNNGEIVAMTGDGVNDAPALLAADIGVAVGNGTDVAKEASDLILLNNSFSIIVHAIEEGRRIIDNLKKIIAYLLSTSFSEVFVVAGALAIGGPIPLLPTQILWTNIIEEGLMSFAFAFEPKEDGVMKRRPQNASGKNIISRELKLLIAVIGVITGVFLIGLYLVLFLLGTPIEKLRTIMFFALSLGSIFFSFSLKNLRRPVWQARFFSNLYLIAALLTSIGLLFSTLVFSPLRALLSLTPLSGKELLLLFGIGVFNLLAIELVKFFIFWRQGKKPRVGEIGKTIKKNRI